MSTRANNPTLEFVDQVLEQQRITEWMRVFIHWMQIGKAEKIISVARELLGPGYQSRVKTRADAIDVVLSVFSGERKLNPMSRRWLINALREAACFPDSGPSGCWDPLKVEEASS
jgi:mannose/cellobiose epimerase-like protein (N-acyl-D-glucosamine 2-epimerase family)